MQLNCNGICDQIYACRPGRTNMECEQYKQRLRQNPDDIHAWQHVYVYFNKDVPFYQSLFPLCSAKTLAKIVNQRHFCYYISRSGLLCKTIVDGMNDCNYITYAPVKLRTTERTGSIARIPHIDPTDDELIAILNNLVDKQPKMFYKSLFDLIDQRGLFTLPLLKTAFKVSSLAALYYPTTDQQVMFKKYKKLYAEFPYVALKHCGTCEYELVKIAFMTDYRMWHLLKPLLPTGTSYSNLRRKCYPEQEPVWVKIQRYKKTYALLHTLPSTARKGVDYKVVSLSQNQYMSPDSKRGDACFIDGKRVNTYSLKLLN